MKDSEYRALDELVSNVLKRLIEEAEHLSDLDSAIGDAEHGTNMKRGFQKVETTFDKEVSKDSDLAATIQLLGKIMASNIGGASGSLYGSGMMAASQELDDGLDRESAVAFADAYLEKVKDRGEARVGDQTMVDALEPAVLTFKRSIELDDEHPVTALTHAVESAEAGVEFTKHLQATKGRASYVKLRSVGHQDPGATSTQYILEEIHETVRAHLDEPDTTKGAIEPPARSDRS
jgi:dihydroxyacetone kinase-like protein